MVRVGILKTGNIATSLVVELMLDERADREDLEVRVVGSGAKISDIAKEILRFRPDLTIYSTPNCSLALPRSIIRSLASSGLIVISDSPGIKIKEELEKLGVGYIFVKADSMIGARREFLDPIEMVIFNSDMLKVLSVTGAFRAVQEAIDLAIDGIKEGKLELPRVIVDRECVRKYSGIRNPYALAKATAAYVLAEEVGKLNMQACFKISEMQDYILGVASAHEILRIAAKLAEEAREIEKGRDSLLRKPHSKKGEILKKRKLFDKPQR